MAAVARHQTAIRRNELSRPIRLAMDAGLLPRDSCVFDYGCGHGDDLRLLREQGYRCCGWDPVLRPRGKKKTSDVVNLGYVVNVIEDTSEREAVLLDAWSYATRLMVVAARHKSEERHARGETHEDGLLTSRNTFQKYYSQDELSGWTQECLGIAPVAAAPGVLFVFREEEDRQSYMASRYRRRAAAPRPRKSDALFEQHQGLLLPLMRFYGDRGRLPSNGELSEVNAVFRELGSLKKAFRIIVRVTGEEYWASVRRDRMDDLLVYLALLRFGKRPQLAALPQDIQRDIKDFFSSYARACVEADRLLFSVGDIEAVDRVCASAPVGKKTPTALYIHASALGQLPTALRVYEGCASRYVGNVDGANIVKLHRTKPQVTYLCYPDFDRKAHPVLVGALKVHLQTLDVEYRDFSVSENPPLLHRKELFVASDYAKRDLFESLTNQEERAGLLDETSRIGTCNGWEDALNAAGKRLRGHRLVKAP